ncbi:MAG: helix-turn-helix transcriptional regulator [Anaerovoracaceae bacterium]
MNELYGLVKTPSKIEYEIKENVKLRRKEAKLSQRGLSEKSGVSLGSIKRFETTGQISLEALIKIGIVLQYEDDFSQLFAKKIYRSIEEIIDEQN